MINCFVSGVQAALSSALWHRFRAYSASNLRKAAEVFAYNQKNPPERSGGKVSFKLIISCNLDISEEFLVDFVVFNFFESNSILGKFVYKLFTVDKVYLLFPGN